jgi:ubiquitin-protein ligase
MSDRTKRIMDEFNKLKNSRVIPIVKCEFINGDINNWKVSFKGSSCSPYEDGIFELKVNLPNEYPDKRPWLYFITKMFHPNIQQSDGKVSITLLYNWVKSFTIEEVINGFIQVMEEPEVGPGYGEEPQKLLEKDRDAFFEKVEEYTMKYAMNNF